MCIMSAICRDISTEMLMPLFDCIVINTLVQVLTLLQDDYLILGKEYLKQDIFLNLNMKGDTSQTCLLVGCHDITLIRLFFYRQK